MKYLIAALLMLISADSMAKEQKLDRETAMARIEKACHEDLKDEDSFENYKEVCECSVRNFRIHLPEEHLELITKAHEGDEAAEATLNQPKFEDLMLLDYDISYSCAENPSFVYKKE
jgi:hypothetical protein